MNSSFFLGSVASALGFFTLFTKFRFQQNNKDTKSSALSLPSPPTSLPQNCKHQVFPSFHGADVRKTVLSHILESFRRKGVDTFNDNEIERSKSIGPELVEAIRGSKIAIVLLSKKYASSSWCLDELAEIMKCREELSQIVMPVFYEVDPTDIKKQTGVFGKAFRETCKGKSKEHIERWRKALEDVAKIAGEHSHNWKNEADMIEKIATNISNILNNTPSRDFEDVVGMKAHMEHMERLLSLDSDEVRMIGIWGPPGIGKTTIARFLFNQTSISDKFQFRAIMEDIRGCYPNPCLDEYSAQLKLQDQMMSKIINQSDMISHLGVAPERLKDKKVFLVLDDVDRLGQLNALAKKLHWFGPGSRIIITTEDLRVLKAHGITHIYKVEFPSSDEAFEIFCMHAFGQKYPYDGFYELAWVVVALAGNLPLGLKVLGSAMRGMSKEEWGRTLPRLKNCLNGEIKSIIQFSYDALSDEDKDLFLYIACLFTNKLPHQVEEVLAKKFWGVQQGLRVLTEKSLISVNFYDKTIQMHTLLQQFGRETSRKKKIIHGIAKHQLLVDERDIREVLSDDKSDARRFIGINFDISKSEEELDISDKSFERMSDLQFVRIKGKDLSHPETLHSLLCHPQKIRSLEWTCFQNICLPSTFNPEFLIKLDMRHSKLQKLWDGTKQLRNLKWMDLSYCTDLKELPDFSTANNLEELNLQNCTSLVELPTSIGKLTNLQVLNLENCASLVKLPSSIENATSLKDLNLRDCSNLVELPSFGNATKLERLNLCKCSNLVKLPSSINATNLQSLIITCPRVEELFAIENATNLRCLELDNCSSLLELPYIGTATNLEILDIRGYSRSVKLPDFIVTNLRRLRFRSCISLLKLPSFIGNFTNLIEFRLINCSSLVELPVSIGTVTTLQELRLRGCSSLVKLPSSIGDFTNLTNFDLSGCRSLLELPPSIGTATNLRELNISGCSSLMKLPSSIGDLINLREFDLSNCSSLMEFPSFIANLQQLSVLRMCGWSKLEAFPTNINLESLDRLDLADCSQLKTFPEISTNIWYLNLIGTAIKEVPLSIMSWSRLSYFHMSYSESLKEYPHALDIITNLYLNKDIQEVAPWVKRISRLHRLCLSDCNNLVSIPQFSDSLSHLDAKNCKSLERLDCSFNSLMISLDFTNCFKLNQEARDLIMHPSTRGSAILPGSQVPVCFEYQASGGSSLTIKLNERLFSSSLKFKACMMLVMDEEETGDDEISVHVKIKIKQNDLEVRCTGDNYFFIDQMLTDHIYTFEVEPEMVITSTELVLEFILKDMKLKIGECGLLQIGEVPSSK